MAVERRFNPASAEFRPEIRSVAGSTRPHIQGYGSVFGKRSRNLGGFVEQVDGGAFRSAMSEGFPDVVCRYNHSDDWLLGTTKAGTCILSVDGTGLHYDTEIPDTTRGNDVAVLAKRGDITSSSFAFRVPDGGDDWNYRSGEFGGLPLRTLLDLELVDVAPVNTPAYPDATASVRNFIGAIDSLARHFGEDPGEIRSLMESNQIPKLFKRSDRPSVSASPETKENAMGDDQEDRKKLTSKERNDLPASSFAYIDADGKGHFPIHDASHVRNALARIAQGAQYGQQALPKVKAAAKKFGIDSEGSDDSKRELEDDELVLRALEFHMELAGLDFDEERAKGQLPPWLQKKADAKDSESAPVGSDDDDESHEDGPKAKKPVAKRDNSTNEDDDKSESDDEEVVGSSPSTDDPDDSSKTSKRAAGGSDDEDAEGEKDKDDEDDSENRASPGQPESKSDKEADEKDKADAEAEMKKKMAALENKRKLTELMEKRYDPWFFDGE